MMVRVKVGTNPGIVHHFRKLPDVGEVITIPWEGRLTEAQVDKVTAEIIFVSLV